MTTHLTEDDLVLHFYGEMDAATETRGDVPPGGLRRMPPQLHAAPAGAGSGRRDADAGAARGFRTGRLGASRTGPAGTPRLADALDARPGKPGVGGRRRAARRRRVLRRPADDAAVDGSLTARIARTEIRRTDPALRSRRAPGSIADDADRAGERANSRTAGTRWTSRSNASAPRNSSPPIASIDRRVSRDRQQLGDGTARRTRTAARGACRQSRSALGRRHGARAAAGRRQGPPVQSARGVDGAAGQAATDPDTRACTEL